MTSPCFGLGDGSCSSSPNNSWPELLLRRLLCSAATTTSSSASGAGGSASSSSSLGRGAGAQSLLDISGDMLVAIDYANLPECAICLETAPADGKAMLSCGHIFCRCCLSMYARKATQDKRKPVCPTCRREVTPTELDVLLSLLRPEQVRACSRQNLAALLSPEEEAAQKAFLELARSMNLKRCPICQVIIEKNGGCDQMTCRCGNVFDWRQAPTVVPCEWFHDHPSFSIWGSSCPGCSWRAKLKLLIQRTVIMVGGVAALPFVLVLAGAGIVCFVAILAGNGIMEVARLLRCKTECLLQRCTSKCVKHHEQKARELLVQAQRLVELAEQELRLEQQKWFNAAGVEAAQQRLQDKCAILAEARLALREMEEDAMQS
eukprot:TRINITY_DN7883_c0_g1_i1.p1 TRINITY_DN7883_c0_g1~~TRINITY_DN7883_c0_g1_i1.p1  ORF type:complete len:376 (+),score=74.22 TRINITY_DN7883_c0_g1_i1:133-1260(+)